MSATSERLAGLQWREDGSEPNEQDLILDAVVVMRATDAETGESSVFIVRTDGTDEVVLAGLIGSAWAIGNNG